MNYIPISEQFITSLDKTMFSGGTILLSAWFREKNKHFHIYRSVVDQVVMSFCLNVIDFRVKTKRDWYQC